MSNSKDKQVSSADEIRYMGALKNKMLVGDYNNVIASMREIADIEQTIEKQGNTSKKQENQERE